MQTDASPRLRPRVDSEEQLNGTIQEEESKDGEGEEEENDGEQEERQAWRKEMADLGQGAEEMEENKDVEGVEGGGGGGGEGDGGGGYDEDTMYTPQGLPSLETLHCTSVSTLKWCPKAARGEFAREAATIWQKASDSGEDRHLSLHLMFVRCILPAGQGPRSGASRAAAIGLGRTVKERLRRWKGGEVIELWEEAVEQSRVKPRRGRKRQVEEETQASRNAVRARTLTQDGQYSRACQALTSAGMAPTSLATRTALQEKHPEEDTSKAPRRQEESVQSQWETSLDAWSPNGGEGRL